jgi:hypothetical protein
MITNHQQYIEQYFSGKPDFGRQVFSLICRNGDGINKIILKIVLPMLPDGIKYKNNCFYDLLKNVKLTIGGTIVFEYKSEQLKKIDIITKKYGKTIYLKDSNTNNVIYYPIDLSDIFGRSVMSGVYDSQNTSQIFDLTFKGIRLCDLSHNEVKLHIELNDIFNVIENKIDKNSSQFEELKNLELIECLLLVNYILSQKKLNRNKKKLVKQTIKNLYMDDQYTNLNLKSKKVSLEMNLPIAFDNNRYKIKKMIFNCEQGNKLNKYRLQVNTQEICCVNNPAEMNVIYGFDNNETLEDNTYAIDMDSMKLKRGEIVVLNLWFNDPIDKSNVYVLFQTEKKCIYDNGCFGFS